MANYLPPVTSVYSRGEALRWMQAMGWSQAVIDSIMYNDNPTEQRLRDLVYRHGPTRAYEILSEGVQNADDRHQRIQSVETAARGGEAGACPG